MVKLACGESAAAEIDLCWSICKKKYNENDLPCSVRKAKHSDASPRGTTLQDF